MGAFSQRLQGCMFAPQMWGKSGIFILFFLNLITPLAVFIPAERRKKAPRSIIFASLFKRLVVILPSADQHVQYNVVYSLSLCGFLNRERDPFLLPLAPIQGFLLPFKWAVDEVSLIRLSQLTLVSAVCFPSKGVLTSPILFLYPPLCTFHPGFHPKKKPFSGGPNGLFYKQQFPNDIGYLEWVTRLEYMGKAFKVVQWRIWTFPPVSVWMPEIR